MNRGAVAASRPSVVKGLIKPSAPKTAIDAPTNALPLLVTTGV